MDKIVVGIASIRRRRATLPNAINSLLDQTVPPDEINVYLNDYTKNKLKGIDESKHTKVNIYDFHDNGDMGDTGKYFKVGEHSGYYLSADDDLKYPRDYVEYTTNCIEKFNRKYVIAMHGSIFYPPINDFINDRHIVKFKSHVKEFTPVHIPGTGVTAFHTDTINLIKEDFELPNMADIWFGIQAQKQKVGILVAPHKKKYVNSQPITDIKQSLYFQTKDNADKRKLYTQIANKIENWKLFAEDV